MTLAERCRGSSNRGLKPACHIDTGHSSNDGSHVVILGDEGRCPLARHDESPMGGCILQ